MTVNVTAYLNNFGKTYEALLDAEYITYKTKPSGYPGDAYIGLDMAKEGVYLTFNNDDRSLIEVILTLFKENDNKYTFPNELPVPLWDRMFKQDVRNKFGVPQNSYPPYRLINKNKGGVDHYIMRMGDQKISMLLHYNLDQLVMRAAFKPTELVEWKELDPSMLLP